MGKVSTNAKYDLKWCYLFKAFKGLINQKEPCALLHFNLLNLD